MGLTLKFKTVDVFTDRAFCGNPLAIFLNCKLLEKEQMQSIAREIGYSETAFVFRPDDPINSALIRIFSPASELPFAGHPNIGVAFILLKYPEYLPGKLLGDKLMLEQKAGLVEATRLKSDQKGVRGSEIQAPEEYRAYDFLPIERICKALSIDSDDICAKGSNPIIASVGLPFAIVRLSSIKSLLKCFPNISEFNKLDTDFNYAGDGFSILVYAFEDNQSKYTDYSIRARVFCPLMGIVEDAATGSACAALAGNLLSLTNGNQKKLNIAVAQGVEMGRPSTIYANAYEYSDGSIRVKISGECVELIDGTLEI